MADPHNHGGIPDDPAQFREAVAAFRDRVPMTDELYGELTDAEREFAFRVANVAQADVVSTVYDAVERAVRDGTDFETFQNDVGDMLEASWGGEVPGRLETIFRTNVMSSYNAGRYRLISAPTVKSARPYWRWDVVIDARTSDDICRPIGKAKVVLPADHSWSRTHYPPLHPNALADGTLVTAARGQIPIEAIEPGELVLTHRGRWRPVYVVMSKRRHAAALLRVQLSTGRELLITKEHPVLVPEGWKAAGNLKIGDKLFEHGEPVAGVSEMAVADPKDFPPLFHQEGIAYDVVRHARRSLMGLAVDFQRDAGAWEGEVDNVWADRTLKDRLVTKQRLDAGLGAVGARSQIRHQRGAHAFARLAIEGGVCFPHPVGVAREEWTGFLAHAVAPVVGTGRLGRLAVRDARLGDARPDRDLVTPAPPRQARFSQAHLALDVANRPALLDVLGRDQARNEVPVGQINWRHSTILSIAEVIDHRSLWNIGVREDESYVAEGQIVHNCRTVVTPLTEDEARAEGITSSPPHVDVVDGFGAAPSVAGNDWEPEPDAYEPAIAAELDDKLAETG